MRNIAQKPRQNVTEQRINKQNKFNERDNMPDVKGTRVYWKSATSAGDQAQKQILKNSAYISVVLAGVQYKADGNFWQKLFGGSDKITVSTQITWQSTGDPKVAAAIQDVRKIDVPSINPLAIGRNVVLKVPAVADGLEMQVKISAVSDDNLGKALQLLNGDDFKQPLQLAPVAVGQILTITNLVKKVLSDTDPSEVLTATYPAIISDTQTPDPLSNNRLVEGYIIVIVKQDDEDQLDFDPAGLSVDKGTVLFGKQPIRNTYMVYLVSSEQTRGRAIGSAWSNKFAQASSKADELMFAAPDKRQTIIAAAYDLLKEGGALLDNDDNYLDSERSKWKLAAYHDVTTKIGDNTGKTPSPAPLSLTGTMRSLGLKQMIEVEGLTDEDVRDRVAAFADELAKAGLPLGFTRRLQAPTGPKPKFETKRRGNLDGDRGSQEKALRRA
jgi:hypothetical protein